MKPKEVKLFVYLTIGFAATIWGIVLFFSGAPPISYESLKALNGSTAAVAIIWALYFGWGWKWPYLRKLLYRPNLNGTWIGEFKSDWKDKNGNGIPPGRFVLVIRQSFFSISIRAYSEKQKTLSYVESLVLDDERGTKLLAYLYAEKRTTSVDHGARQGAAELDVIEESNRRTLEGDFWTHTGTTGFVRVRQSSAELHVESFEQAARQWGEPDQWASVQR